MPSTMQTHHSKPRAMVKWWRDLYAELKGEPHDEIESRHLAILQALLGSLVSPLGSVIAAEAFELDERFADEEADQRQAEIDTELARRMLWYAYQLGRGAIRQTGRPPLSGEQFTAIEQTTVWEQAPVPAGC